MIIARSPLRLSFFGGGTDFPEYFTKESGAVLATTIDKYAYVTASPFQSVLFDYSVRISYSKGETVRSVGEIQHPVYRECLRLLKFEKDVELHAVADLPSFTGLGSSSTFTVSLLQALHAFKGDRVDALTLAYEAIHIERQVLKESVGCQDQTAAAVGGLNVLEFRTETDIRVHPLNLPNWRLAEMQSHLFIVYTGIKRRAAEIEAKKLQSLERNRESLRLMRKMVDQGRDVLVGSGSLAPFGYLLNEAWTAKRGLESGVSNSEIDALYRRGIDAGAWGGKLLGAGGGGFLLFMAPPEAQTRLHQAFSGEYVLRFRIASPGAKVIFDQGSE